MSSISGISADAETTPPVRRGEFRLEVVVIPVSDVDRAKAFYEGLGWRLDADESDGHGFRGVQLTPPGSGCSIQFGTNVTALPPGSVQSLYLVVADLQAAREELIAGGAEVSEIFHEGTIGARYGAEGRLNGIAPDGGNYTSFAVFSDPDGNGWLLQEVQTRLPGHD